MDKIRLFITGIFLILALSRPAYASSEGPITSYFPYADTIYLVRVIEVKDHVVSFAITEVVRGKAVESLALPAEFSEIFKPGSKWLLLSCEPWRKTGFRENVVGDFLHGSCGWIFSGVSEGDSKTTPNALTAENIKRISDQNPQKPWHK